MGLRGQVLRGIATSAYMRLHTDAAPLHAECCRDVKLKVDGACLRAGPVWVRMRDGFTVADDCSSSANTWDGFCESKQIKGADVMHSLCSSLNFAVFFPWDSLLQLFGIHRTAMTSPEAAAFFPSLEGRELAEKAQRHCGQLAIFARSHKQEKASPLKGQAEAMAHELKKEPVEGVVDVLVALRCFLPLH